MKRFSNILVICSRDHEDDQALKSAIQIAEQQQASITLLQVLPPLSQIQLMDKAKSASEITLAYQNFYQHKLQRRAEQYTDQALIRCKVVIGTVFLEAIRTVLRNQHDLVIKTAEPAGWLQRLFGSTDMHLLRKCPCPLWLLKPGLAPAFGTVAATVELVPAGMDRNEDALNQQIAEIAASTATMHHASLHFLHAWQPQDAGLVMMWCDNPALAAAEFEQSIHQEHLNAFSNFKQQVKGWLGEHAFDYLQPHFVMLRGEPSQVLVEKAQQLAADLVVMGTVGRSGIAGMLIGNTAESMLEQLNCSVLAVKPTDFICPITLEA